MSHFCRSRELIHKNDKDLGGEWDLGKGADGCVNDGHVGSPGLEEHFEDLWTLALGHCFLYHKVKLAMEKSYFFRSQVKMLGYGILDGKVCIAPEKGEPVANSLITKSQKEVRSFAMTVAIHYDGIPNFADTFRPLYNIFRGQLSDERPLSKWNLNPIYEESFLQLRSLASDLKIIRRYDPDCPLLLISDAGETVSASILCHCADVTGDRDIGMETKLAPIKYRGRVLKGAELRYSSAEKEVLSVVDGVLKV
jgi:hypothetical protein